jgi:hypothetical protein
LSHFVFVRFFYHWQFATTLHYILSLWQYHRFLLGMLSFIVFLWSVNIHDEVSWPNNSWILLVVHTK